jgi:quinol monooxygenase YgiN
MATIVIKHKVANYAKWKPIFDEHQKARLENGMTGHSVCRDADDPNTVVVIGRVKDINKARAFTKSDALKNAMMKAGVQGAPEIWFLQDEEDKRY